MLTFAYTPDGGMFFHRSDHVPENYVKFCGVDAIMLHLSTEQIDRLSSKELGADVVVSRNQQEAAVRLWNVWLTKYPKQSTTLPVGTPELGRIMAIGRVTAKDERPVYKVYAVYNPYLDRGKFSFRDKIYGSNRIRKQTKMIYDRILDEGPNGMQRLHLKAWLVENWAAFKSRQEPEKLLRWSIRKLSEYQFLHVVRYETKMDARRDGLGVSALEQYNKARAARSEDDPTGLYSIGNFYSNFDSFVSTRAGYEGV